MPADDQRLRGLLAMYGAAIAELSKANDPYFDHLIVKLSQQYQGIERLIASHGRPLGAPRAVQPPVEGPGR